MFEIPRADIRPNSLDYETKPLISPNGFREYDARWLYGTELNLVGAQALGAALGTLIHETGIAPRVVVGHDYRAYSAAIKHALSLGLIAAGCHVHDIGLALTPMAYFAQFALDCPAVAMVTASHNENGWTGVKMGMDWPLTFGPDEMARLSEITRDAAQIPRPGGGLTRVSDMKARYLDDLARRTSFTRPLKLVIACGNGTAGAFAPKLFERLGCQVVPMDCTLDHTFPRYNPNPEDLVMLGALGQRVRDEGADVGLAFDGDGDRCGVVDETGAPIFSDKVGLLLARDLVTHHASAQFVVDVKSTGLYLTDPVLKEAGASTDYYKTGHSYLKQRVKALGALAGFEKSGHFFFGPPLGRGYDDGLVSGLAVCDLLEHNRDQSLGTLFKGLPHSFSSPTMSAPCADEAKYGVVEKAADALMAMMEQGTPLASQRLVEANRINGIRITAEDGTWGLIRASSNKPELVVVVESPTSRARLEAMFEALDTLLRRAPGIGPYNQTI